MEISDNDEDEEIIDLNVETKKSKVKFKNEKTKSTKSSSSNKMKWIKSNYESLSQLAKNEIEENENTEHDEEHIKNNIEKLDDNADKNNVEKSLDHNSENNVTNGGKNKSKGNINEMHNEYNSPNDKKKILYTFIWENGGESVKLIGSFSNWKQQFDMQKDERDQLYKFTLPLDNEKYQYKFIVDGVWKYSTNQITMDDGYGNINNVIDLTNFKPKEEIKEKSHKIKGKKTKKEKFIKIEKIKEEKEEKIKEEKEENIEFKEDGFSFDKFKNTNLYLDSF